MFYCILARLSISIVRNMFWIKACFHYDNKDNHNDTDLDGKKHIDNNNVIENNDNDDEDDYNSF